MRTPRELPGRRHSSGRAPGLRKLQLAKHGIEQDRQHSGDGYGQPQAEAGIQYLDGIDDQLPAFL